jgi:hypothetical protein
MILTILLISCQTSTIILKAKTVEIQGPVFPTPQPFIQEKTFYFDEKTNSVVMPFEYWKQLTLYSIDVYELIEKINNLEGRKFTVKIVFNSE